MNTSAFIGGILIGAAATTLLSRNRGRNMITSVMGGNAKDKMMDMANIGIGSSHRHDAHGSHNDSYSKGSSVTQIKDFIRTNPDVKREVDMILKETNTVIPGL